MSGIKSNLLVDDGFNIGLAFTADFPEALSSSSWIGIASLTYFFNSFHNLNPKGGLILESRWNFNFNAVSSVSLENLCPRQGRIVHRFLSTLLRNFPVHLEVTSVLGIKIDSLLHSVMEEHRRIVQLLPN